MDAIIILMAIFFALWLSSRTDQNVGIISAFLAYLLGVFYFNLPIDRILSGFPVDIFIMIFGISFFFNIANENGTLKTFANNILYHFRNHVFWLPMIYFLITFFIAMLGAGFFAAVPIVAVAAFSISKKTHHNRMVYTIAINLGGYGGSNFPTSAHGNIIQQRLELTELADQATALNYAQFTAAFIFSVIFIFCMMVITQKQVQVEAVDLDKPEPMIRKQKLNILLILLFFALIVLTPILASSLDVLWLEQLASQLDIGFVAIFFALIAFALDLGKPAESFNLIPWSTIWVLCGMSMLISVGVDVGLVELLTQIISWVPLATLPFALAIIAGFMALFSSGVGVVMPMMFPLIASLSALSGYSPLALLISIILGINASTVSPFSGGGSIFLATCGFKEKSEFFYELLYKSTPLSIIAAAIFSQIVALFI